MEHLEHVFINRYSNSSDTLKVLRASDFVAHAFGWPIAEATALVESLDLQGPPGYEELIFTEGPGYESFLSLTEYVMESAADSLCSLLPQTSLTRSKFLSLGRSIPKGGQSLRRPGMVIVPTDVDASTVTWMDVLGVVEMEGPDTTQCIFETQDPTTSEASHHGTPSTSSNYEPSTPSEPYGPCAPSNYKYWVLPSPECRVQLAPYIIETMCTLGSRRFLLGLTIEGWNLALWHYDSAGVIASEKFDMRFDFSIFVLTIVGLLCSPYPRLGFEPLIQFPTQLSCPPHSIEGASIDIPEGTKLFREDGEVLELPSGLHITLEEKIEVDQRSAVYGARLPPDFHEPGLAVNLSWRPITRRREEEKIHFAQRSDNTDLLYYISRFRLAFSPTDSRSLLSQSAGVRKYLLAGVDYENYELRIVVYKRPLTLRFLSISHAPGPKALLAGFLAVMKAHHEMSLRPGTSAHDISINTVVFDTYNTRAPADTNGYFLDLDPAKETRPRNKINSESEVPLVAHSF